MMLIRRFSAYGRATPRKIPMPPGMHVDELREPLRVLAERHGVSTGTALRWRREQGVSVPPIPMPPDAQLHEPLAVLAERHGVSTGTALRWRREQGILKGTISRGPRPSSEDVSCRVEARHPGLVEALKAGRENNTEIAARYDLSRERVRQIRESLGLPAWRRWRRGRKRG